MELVEPRGPRYVIFLNWKSLLFLLAIQYSPGATCSVQAQRLLVKLVFFKLPHWAELYYRGSHVSYRYSPAFHIIAVHNPIVLVRSLGCWRFLTSSPAGTDSHSVIKLFRRVDNAGGLAEAVPDTETPKISCSAMKLSTLSAKPRLRKRRLQGSAAGLFRL